MIGEELAEKLRDANNTAIYCAVEDAYHYAETLQKAARVSNGLRWLCTMRLAYANRLLGLRNGKAMEQH